jgi:hypothetical protein
MDWVLIVAVAVVSGLTATAVCVKYLRSRAKSEKRQVGYLRDEIRMNAADVPQFKPTWRNTR